MTNESLTACCLELPGVTEGIKWEDHLCYMVGGKLFLLTGFQDQDQVSFKVSPEDFATLCERDGIIQAPYFARNQWVAVTKRSALKPGEWKHYIEQAYLLIRSKLTKKLQQELAQLDK